MDKPHTINLATYYRIPVHEWIEKPWGGYEEHYRASDLSVCSKTLVVLPGHQLSLQYHNLRNEVWYISSDDAYFEMTLGDKVEKLNGKHRFDIPIGMNHTVRNLGKRILVIEEMQYGECKEDDIVRLSDPYQRTGR